MKLLGQPEKTQPLITWQTAVLFPMLKVLDDIEERPDFIVLDTPRDGIHPKALERIIDYGVNHMVYISCKPTSLARDLDILLEKEYRSMGLLCGYVPGNRACGDGCLAFQRRNRLEKGSCGVLAVGYGYVRVPE